MSSPNDLEPAAVTDRTDQSALFLATLVLVTALGPLAMSSFVPAIPAIQRDFGVSGQTAQLTLSVSILSMAFASLVYGNLADRLGRRPVLLGGIAVGLAGSLISALSPNIETVIVGRALQAAGSSTGLVLARVIVRDTYGDARAANVLAYITAAMTLAPMIGPIAGGHLIDSSGWRGVFWAVAAVSAGLLAIVAWRLPETRPAGVGSGPTVPKWQVLKLLRDGRYLKFLAYGTMSQAAFFSFVSGAPYIMTETLGYPATVYGYYFVMVPVGFLVGSATAGVISGRHSREALTLTGAFAGLCACSIGWFWTAGTMEPLALFLPAALLAMSSGIGIPNSQAGMLAAAGPMSGAASGLFSFIQLITSATASQVVGSLQALGAPGVFGVMLGAASLALLGYGLAARHDKHLLGSANRRD